MFSRYDFQVPAGYTPETHTQALRAAFIEAGWGEPVDEYGSSSDQVLVFRPLSSGPFASRLHLRFTVLSYGIVNFALADGWNSASHSSTKLSQDCTAAYAASPSQPINYSLLAGPSGFIVSSSQGSYYYTAGAFKPDITLPQWDTSKYLPYLVGDSVSLYAVTGSGNNPWNSSDYSTTRLNLRALGLSAVDPLTNTRLLASSPVVTNVSSLIGTMPADTGFVPSFEDRGFQERLKRPNSRIC